MGSRNRIGIRSSASPAGTPSMRTTRPSSGLRTGSRVMRRSSVSMESTASSGSQARWRCSRASSTTSESATLISSPAGTSSISISPTYCDGWRRSGSTVKTSRAFPGRPHVTPSGGGRSSTSSAHTGRCTRPRRSPTGSMRSPGTNSGRRRSATAGRSLNSGDPTRHVSWSTTTVTSSSASGSIKRTTSSSSTARSRGTSVARSTGR